MLSCEPHVPTLLSRCFPNLHQSCSKLARLTSKALLPSMLALFFAFLARARSLRCCVMAVPLLSLELKVVAIYFYELRDCQLVSYSTARLTTDSRTARPLRNTFCIKHFARLPFHKSHALAHFLRLLVRFCCTGHPERPMTTLSAPANRYGVQCDDGEKHSNFRGTYPTATVGDYS